MTVYVVIKHEDVDQTVNPVAAILIGVYHQKQDAIVAVVTDNGSSVNLVRLGNDWVGTLGDKVYQICEREVA